MQKRPKCVSCQETNLFWVWHIYEHKQEDIELKGTVVQSLQIPDVYSLKQFETHTPRVKTGLGLLADV
jgi:hypothetical protein